MAESRPGVGVGELARARRVPNNQIGVTTAGQIRAAEGDVVRTKGRSPNHVTVTGISLGDLSDAFGQPVRNPVPPDERLLG